MFHNFDPQQFVIYLVVIVASISLHEFGHAISADYLGDPTPRRDGRITLWPDKHFDPLGFLMVVITTFSGYGIGWGKPVMVNPRFFKHPRRDMMIVAAFGPLMNLLLALVFGFIVRVLLHRPGGEDWPYDPVSGNMVWTFQFLWAFVYLNLFLMFFNLLPIHPLDGSKILGGLLPADQAIRYDRFGYQWGPLIIMIAVLSGTGIIGKIVMPAVAHMIRIIVGFPVG